MPAPTESHQSDFSHSLLSFRTPADGVYRIGFSPCAMWGGEGDVRICTK
jgi:hypothetical protein